ncbi:MAG TPA: M81 family metallopeptidase [Acidobacteriaceae bacterium]|nr:M81 family metallopeptidase [Acidobacteriaceae bacterium]
MRVAILGFLHESNTFLSAPTHYEDFERASLTRDEAMIARWTGAHHELGGMIAGCQEENLTIAGGMATFAIPSGTITAEAYERLAHELIAALEDALPVQGLLVALHGATVSADYPDADGEILRRIRQVVGPELPVIVTLDLHANISEEMVHQSTALICYRTNPHLDQRDRGFEAARLLARTLRGEVHPVQAIVAPPLVLQISRQYTSEAPARLLYDKLNQVLAWPGILSASIAMGFYYADVVEMGASFVAVTDRDRALAERAANSMAAVAWENRQSFCANLPDAAGVVHQAIRSPKKPVVLLDIGDNVGAGSPADSTILWSEIQKQGARNALVILYDPAAVQQCVRTGVRSEVELLAGGKTDGRHGQPVALHGRVRTLSDGVFVETQIRHGGWGGGDQGITAVVETKEGHTIVLTSHRMSPMSLEQILSLGIHPERKDILIVKGVVAPRAAYEPIAGEIILAGTPGVTEDDPRAFPYRHRRKPLFPLETTAEFPVRR